MMQVVLSNYNQHRCPIQLDEGDIDSLISQCSIVGDKKDAAFRWPVQLDEGDIDSPANQCSIVRDKKDTALCSNGQVIWYKHCHLCPYSWPKCFHRTSADTSTSSYVSRKLYYTNFSVFDLLLLRKILTDCLPKSKSLQRYIDRLAQNPAKARASQRGQPVAGRQTQ